MRHLLKMVIAIIATTTMVVVSNAAAKNAKALFYDSGTGSTMATNKAALTKKILPKEKESNAGVRYWIELSHPGENEMFRVNADRVFRSGERVRIHYTSNYDGYLYVMQKGSTGTNSLLFPTRPGTKQNLVKAGQDFSAPAPGWFKFDKHAGFERIQVVFFPLNGDPAMVTKLSSNRISRVVLQDELRRLIARTAGSRDLITEIDNSFFSNHPDTIGAPIMPKPGLAKVSDTAMPAAYVVNTAKGRHIPPVVFEIVMKHE